MGRSRSTAAAEGLKPGRCARECCRSAADSAEDARDVEFFLGGGLGLVGETQRQSSEQLLALIARRGLGEQEPLSESAAELAQYLELLLALDAFRDHLDVQVPRDRDDGADDREIARVGDEVAHEAAVDLEVVDVPVLEVIRLE